ncbi:MAG: pentapeptide repeat-containing protein [Planctomycetota bacterium]
MGLLGSGFPGDFRRTPGTFRGSSLRGTSLRGTSFRGTSFRGTSFRGTSFRGTRRGDVAGRHVVDDLGTRGHG